jgi:hypothetical protein
MVNALLLVVHAFWNWLDPLLTLSLMNASASAGRMLALGSIHVSLDERIFHDHQTTLSSSSIADP